MDYNVAYPFSEAAILEKPVVNKGFSKEQFLTLLQDGAESLYYKRKFTLDQALNAINILRAYLKKYHISIVVPDEKFFATLRKRLKSGAINSSRYSPNTVKKVVLLIRNICNLYFLPKGLISRQILIEGVANKYSRILRLSKKSRDAVVYFEKAGKCIKAEKMVVGNNDNFKLVELRATRDRELTAKVKDAIIRRALHLLEHCRKAGFESVTGVDLEKYRDFYERNGKEKTANKNLSEVLTFFVNLKDAGFIKTNPFDGFRLVRVRGNAKVDFISKENIDQKLRDLSSVKFGKVYNVRDRLICLFFYDLAIRREELASLRCSDIVPEPDGSVRVILRSEIQKGANKDEVVLYLFFEETKKLLLHYLNKVRPRLKPKCDRLFISDRGQPICESRLYRIVRNHCRDELKIKTYFGKDPSPHTFRHTFATLNIAPLGLDLSLDEIVDHLRQVGYEVAKKHYVHNNPYLRKMKHKKYERKANSYGEIESIPLEALKKWMAEKLKLSDKWIREFEKCYQRVVGKQMVLIDAQREDVVSYIDEAEAWPKVSHLGFSKRTFRNHFTQQGKCKKAGRGEWSYNKEYILQLSEEWIDASKVQAAMRRSRTSFYEHRIKMGWESRRIGHVILLRKSDIVLEGGNFILSIDFSHARTNLQKRLNKSARTAKKSVPKSNFSIANSETCERP